MKWLLVIALFVFGVSARAEDRSLWVYTSIYKEYIAQLKKEFEAKNPGIKLQIFQAGSEKIQSKVEAELMAHRVQVDLILSSDPFWCTKLLAQGLLLADGACATNYYSLMVLAAARGTPEASRPKMFLQLADPQYHQQLIMGSPLESGTFFASVSYLSDLYGWDYFKRLTSNEILATGGNSAVIQKLESGEKKYGMVLLENVLAAKKRGSPVEVIYPEEGAIPIPSVRMPLKSTKNPEGIKKFLAYLDSIEGQKILLSAYVYSNRQDLPAPTGARTLSEVTARTRAWTPERISDFAKRSKEIKTKFSAIVFD